MFIIFIFPRSNTTVSRSKELMSQVSLIPIFTGLYFQATATFCHYLPYLLLSLHLYGHSVLLDLGHSLLVSPDTRVFLPRFQNVSSKLFTETKMFISIIALTVLLSPSLRTTSKFLPTVSVIFPDDNHLMSISCSSNPHPSYDRNMFYPISLFLGCLLF